jgi:dipeptidyl aminopeptidase/acylaminoacyl peptidase
MFRSVIIGVCFFLTVWGYAQSDSITGYNPLILNQFENWATISHDDVLLPEYSFLDSLEFSAIKYSSDSLKIDGFMVTPKFVTNTPMVIFNRGGNRDYFKIDDRTLIEWIAPIARHGFSVFASQYRSQDEFGGSDIQDVLNLMEIAKHQPNVDSTKIGMVGWSRGGLMTYQALALTDEIDCAIIGGAPTDMFQLLADRPEFEFLLAKLIPNYKASRNIELEKRSPILWADKLSETELLIMHGELDQRANCAQATRMSAKLDSLGYDHTLRVFDGDDHILNLNRVLKDQEIAIWLKSKMD